MFVERVAPEPDEGLVGGNGEGYASVNVLWPSPSFTSNSKPAYRTQRRPLSWLPSMLSPLRVC